MKKCYILAALPTASIPFKKQKGDLIIAADGGYANALNMGITPDIILGDFDSLGYIPQGKEIIKHPVNKDDTDTLLAVKIGLERGYNCFYIYGGIGGRTDHTLANIQALAFIAENGGKGYLIGDNECISVIRDSFIRFKAEAKGTVSVFSLSENAKGVTITGLHYPLKEYCLNSSYPLGVSNAFIGVSSCIEVKKGTVCVVWNGDINYIQEEN